MDRLQSMTVFAKVVELGSFARAADRLDISTSACSRMVADLESHLGTRLLNRTTRRLSLTESGRAFYERVVEILADLDEAEQAAAHTTAKPVGLLRVNCAVIFGERHLAPVVGEYLRRYPEVRLEVTLSDRIVDIVEEGYDLAIRIGSSGGTNLVARKVGTTRTVVCASPEYLARRGTPRRPEDLADHDCMRYSYVSVEDEWRFTDPAARARKLRIAGSLESNHGGFIRNAALAGVGIALLPSFIVGPDIREGRLVSLLEEYVDRPGNIQAVYPTRKHVPAKVRTFIDFLAERWKAGGEWDLNLP